VFEFSARKVGPKGVDLGKRQAVRLDVELPRDRQERLAAEEILREIDLALWCARQVGEVQGRHPEQRPGPLRVGGGDDRRIDPEKPFSSKNRWIACAKPMTPIRATRPRPGSNQKCKG
jgi:hypothetical protein